MSSLCFVGGIISSVCVRVTTLPHCNAMATWDRILFVMGTNNEYLNENIGYKTQSTEFLNLSFLVLNTINYCDELPHFCVAYYSSMICAALFAYLLAKQKKKNALSQQLNAVFIYLHIFLNFFSSFCFCLPTIWLQMDSVLVMNERYCFVVFAQLSSSVRLFFLYLICRGGKRCHQINN